MNIDTSVSGMAGPNNKKEKQVLYRTHCTHCGKVLSTAYDDYTVIPENGKTYCDCAGTQRAKMMETLNRKDRRDLKRGRGRWRK